MTVGLSNVVLWLRPWETSGECEVRTHERWAITVTRFTVKPNKPALATPQNRFGPAFLSLLAEIELLAFSFFINMLAT